VCHYRLTWIETKQIQAVSDYSDTHLKTDLDSNPRFSSTSHTIQTMSVEMMVKLKRIKLLKNAWQFDNQTSCFFPSLCSLTHSLLRTQCFLLTKAVRIIFPETSRPVLGPLKLPIQWKPELLSSKIKRPELETHNF